MRFQVPQFVDIEDKIVGPLTLKQFLVYLAGVLLLIPVFLRSDLSLFITIAIPVIGISALFAHFRLHGKSLFQVMVNVVTFYIRGPRFMWRRSATDKPLVIDDQTRERWQAEGEYAPEETVRESRLSAVAKELETEGNVSSVDEVDPLADPPSREASAGEGGK